ncbi:MAG: DUF559 domain-containing protein [Propionibacteriaceae bacterium]|nr:DUF559 domain-containing protein [Propionibacteriaceae bacterium]
MHQILATEFHQHGVLSRRRHPTLIGRIDAAVKKGTLVPLMPGTYAPENTFESLVLSVADWDPHAVFASGTAARLTWWPDIRFDAVHALTHRCPRRKVAGAQLSQTPLDADLVMDVGSLRIQHPAASTVDLVRILGADAIDEALRRRATSVAAMLWALRLMPGRADNPQIAQLIHESRDEPWSALERRAHTMLRTAGIRGWRTNLQIRVPWGWVYADIAFPAEKVVVELDGWEFHQARTSFVADRRRDVALHLKGWTVLRFTADSMEELVPQLRQHLTTRRRSS